MGHDTDRPRADVQQDLDACRDAHEEASRLATNARELAEAINAAVHLSSEEKLGARITASHLWMKLDEIERVCRSFVAEYTAELAAHEHQGAA